MPLPLAPVAAVALRYGTFALAGYAIARLAEPGRRCQKAEDAHDLIDEGFAFRRAPQQANATGRLRRVLRLGTTGPAFEIDLTAFGRVKWKRI